MPVLGYKRRFRHHFMTVGTFLVVLLWLLTDPDNNIISHLPYGASTIATIVVLLKTIMYVTVLHLSRRALTDYLDLETVMKKAMEGPTGGGLVFVGIAIIYLALAVLINAAVHY